MTDINDQKVPGSTVPGSDGLTERQLGVVELIRAADEPAPQSLHRSTAELVAQARRSRRRQRLTFAGATATLAATAAVLVLFVLSGPAAPDVNQAIRLASSTATAPAPREDPAASGRLAASVDGTAFPYWDRRLGWRQTGSRRDTIGGHAVSTVFYEHRKLGRVGYSIVAGGPLSARGGRIVMRGGHGYRVYERGGLNAVAWLRDGHTCVIAGRDVSPATLVRLATADEGGGAA
jgi:hypothetical protein